MSAVADLLDHPDAAWLLEERLLSHRGDTVEKLDIREALVQVCFAGGDRVSGRRHLEAACEQATRMGEGERARRLRSRLAFHLLSIGLPALALPHLRRSLFEAVEADDTLMLLSLAVPLSALCLEEEEYGEAMKLGALVVATAQRRGNWLGVADGLITQATCLLTDPNQRIDAVALLLHGGQRLNSLGAAAAVNLIKARLGEIRAELGPETFDPALREALDRLGREGQAT